MENNKTQTAKNQILSTGQATRFEDEGIAMGAEIVRMPSSSAPLPEDRIEVEGVKVNGMAQSVLSAAKPIEWLYTDFLETGEQIIIAGAPKTGNSLLAAQLGLALASGGEFLGWKAVGRRKV
ncbi:AAA family ATPase, partial [Pseudomonas guariconensis]|uniref:AAA family ATPase n=1 Tax=Pseudomonas guariconensis TaxID=1288410 RepID=UPI0034D70028